MSSSELAIMQLDWPPLEVVVMFGIIFGGWWLLGTVDGLYYRWRKNDE